jgi:hypothetical protein
VLVYIIRHFLDEVMRTVSVFCDGIFREPAQILDPYGQILFGVKQHGSSVWHADAVGAGDTG